MCGERVVAEQFDSKGGSADRVLFAFSKGSAAVIGAGGAAILAVDSIFSRTCFVQRLPWRMLGDHRPVLVAPVIERAA